jgi:hypothetical protein
MKLVYSLLGLAVSLLALTTSTVMAQGTRPDEDESIAAVKKGVIRGMVINESGQPLPDVQVTVRAYGSGEYPHSTSTDRDGNFRVSGLRPVLYYATASLPAYTAAPRDPDNTQATSYRIGDTITLVMIKGGVITGSVKSVTGDPVVGVQVRAQMIRDGNGQRSRYGATTRERLTDDRGIYRIYGLPTGTYLVFAGGAGYLGANGGYENDAPTYSPSSLRGNAAEISVRAGEETRDVDIRYRSEVGHTIRGIAATPNASNTSGTWVILTSTLDGGSQLGDSVYQPPGSDGFSFSGVADGKYDLTAESFLPNGEIMISEPRRVNVRGTDISDLKLTIKPLATISGRVVLEESKAIECKGKKRVLPTEILISAWHNEMEAAQDQPQFVWALGGPSFPNLQGEVSLRNLAAGQYQIIARQFAKYWYLDSITLPAATRTTKPGEPSRPQDAVLNWTNLKAGDRLSGLIVKVVGGAASLKGQITTAEGVTLPGRQYVYLVPAEREKSQDVLRFLAAPISPDKKIALNNIPPGRYFIVVQPALDDVRPTLTKLRLPDETETRARLRREAEAAKTEIELKPCQNMTDYQLPFPPVDIGNRPPN